MEKEKTMEERLEANLKEYCTRHDIGWDMVIKGGIILSFAKKFYRREIERARSEERAAVIDSIRKFIVIKQPETASESACDKCGFSNDHIQCNCRQNDLIRIIIESLERIRKEME